MAVYGAAVVLPDEPLSSTFGRSHLTSANAGAVLGYLPRGTVRTGAVVAWIGFRYDWRNSEAGLALNTAPVGLTALNVVLFLVLPGFLSWADASAGIAQFAAAAVFGGIGCRQTAPAV